MKYIDAEELKVELDRQKIGYNIDGKHNAEYDTCVKVLRIIDSLMQEQPDKESLNESQQEFVNIVTERMLKEGPIPTLKGKQKAEFEKEFNRFKQITGMINFPAHMEIYKKVILWFMAWGADNLPNLNKVTDPDGLDSQQEQPEVDFKIEERKWVHDAVDNIFPEDGDFMSEVDFRKILKDTARHFYELGKNSK
jgi:hypothetical protein